MSAETKNRLRRRSVRLLLPVTGFVFGTAIALAQTEWSDPHQRFGNWTGDLLLGKSDESVVARAYRARHQLFALSTDQALYFYLRKDEHGRPLRGECSYVLTGIEPPGRWWSLTAYGTDGFLIREAEGRFSVAAKTNPKSPQPLSVIIGSRGAAATPDIVTAQKRPFYLILRVYAPEQVKPDAWVRILPQARQIGCARS